MDGDDVDKMIQSLGAMMGGAAQMSRVQFVFTAALDILKAKMTIGQKISDEQIEDAARLGAKLVGAVFKHCAQPLTAAAAATAEAAIAGEGMSQQEIDEIYRRQGGKGS